MSNETSAGRVAYEGYFKACGGKSLISGAELPHWHDQADAIKWAWEAAGVDLIDWYRKVEGVS